ncbi:hypothetical protein BX600DRAFT_443209 [Xylariales sp. PMI_506]|nr:hypothetical protein BX600DRAFT_443209 [Xylariales sp. PMI_506]
MAPSDDLHSALNVVTALEICWQLSAAPVRGFPLPATWKDFIKPQGKSPRVADYLQALSASLGNISRNTATSRDLGAVAQSLSLQTDIINNSLTSVSSSEEAPAHSDVRLRHGNANPESDPASIQQILTRDATRLKTWLVETLCDDASAFSKELQALQRDLDAVGSLRSQELAQLWVELKTALGCATRELPTRKAARRRDSGSSSEGGERQPKRFIRKKKKTRHAAKAADDSSALPAWIPRAKTALEKLSALIPILPAEIRIIRHLSYESADAREDSIRDAESETYRWMFDEAAAVGLPPHLLSARISVIRWLSSGDDMFHISGKAGSGKSTLMKFLRRHPQARTELERWAGGRRLVLAGFYFWNSGDTLQMSLEGLSRSLLLEVCRQCPDAIPALFPVQWQQLSGNTSTASADFGLFKGTAITEAFEALTQRDADPGYRMCFFIDGLDEYTDKNTDYWEFARVLRGWSGRTGVKLCVSARPYQEFLDTFDRDHTLHLHDLTRPDIERYARDSLQRAENVNFDTETIHQMADIIADRSQGVFLWARVVTQSLVRLGKRQVDPQQLLQTLRVYPAEIDDLYDSLLAPLEPEERERSNQMLLLAARSPFSQPLNALCLGWIEDLGNPSFPVHGRPYATPEVRARHDGVRADLDWLTKGLLEMHVDRRERRDGDQFYRQRAQFSHRTARDYLRSARKVAELSRSFGETPLSEIYARLRLAEVVMAGKYRASQGADPRRRRLYLNYARSLLGLRDPETPDRRFQVPWRYMETLRQDLETTRAEKFSSAYAVSNYRCIADPNVLEEDPEKAASFLHFIASHGQSDYAVKALMEGFASDAGEETNVLIAAAFGQPGMSSNEFAKLVQKSDLGTVKVRPSLGNDPLADSSKSRRIAVTAVFACMVAFTCLSKKRSKGREASDTKRFEQLFAMLEHLSAASSTIATVLGSYVCILKRADAAAESSLTATTLLQIAEKYAPAFAESLSFSAVSSPALSLWEDTLEKYTFVAVGDLDQYTCTKVVWESDSIAADEDLFVRIY